MTLSIDCYLMWAVPSLSPNTLKAAKTGINDEIAAKPRRKPVPPSSRPCGFGPQSPSQGLGFRIQGLGLRAWI